MEQNTQNVTESYIGAGVIYANGRDVGNVSVAKFAIEQETKELKNYRGGGGNANSITRISGVTLELTLHDYNQENLALACRGNVEQLATESFTDVVLDAVPHGLIETPFMMDISQAVTLKDADDAEIPLEGVDGPNYAITAAGILTYNPTIFADGTKVKVSYHSKARKTLEALINAGVELRIVFNGVNEAAGGRESIVRVHRFKPNPTDGLDLIGDDFGALTLNGAVLADTTKPFGKSQFFTRDDAV